MTHASATDPFAEREPVSRDAMRLFVVATPLTMFIVPDNRFNAVPEPLCAGALFTNFPTFDSSLKILIFFNCPFVTLKFIVPFRVRARSAPDSREKVRFVSAARLPYSVFFIELTAESRAFVSAPESCIFTEQSG